MAKPSNLEAVAKAIKPKSTFLNYVELALAYGLLFGITIMMATAILFLYENFLY